MSPGTTFTEKLNMPESLAFHSTKPPSRTATCITPPSPGKNCPFNEIKPDTPLGAVQRSTDGCVPGPGCNESCPGATPKKLEALVLRQIVGVRSPPSGPYHCGEP